MKYFIDTEFSELGPKLPIVPISVAVIAEDGHEFYAINDAWYRWVGRPKASQWVKDHVLSHLPTAASSDLSSGGSPRHAWEFSRIMSMPRMKNEILEFVGTDSKPEFWGYYADYDWVVFCQIFGSMVDLPKGWPMYCRDIKQLADDMGNPTMPALPNSIEHHALYDAREAKNRYEWLMFTKK